MIRLLWRLIRLLLAIAICAAGAYWGGPYLLTAAGRYLITQSETGKADLAVVLADQPYLLVPEGARLYHDGSAPKIVLLNAPRPRGQEDLARLGIRSPDSLAISLQLLEALRVPRGAILTIPEPADGLDAEVQRVAGFLAGRSVRTMIIVTSKAGSTRARKVFDAVLGARVKIAVHPVPSDPFAPDGWWKNRTDFRQAVWEYAALVNWWLRGLWRAVAGPPETLPPSVTIR